MKEQLQKEVAEATSYSKIDALLFTLIDRFDQIYRTRRSSLVSKRAVKLKSGEVSSISKAWDKILEKSWRDEKTTKSRMNQSKC